MQLAVGGLGRVFGVVRVVRFRPDQPRQKGSGYPMNGMPATHTLTATHSESLEEETKQTDRKYFKFMTNA